MKKRILFFAVVLIGIRSIHSQNTFPVSGSVGIGTTTPNAKSILDIRSTTKGILIPRLTQLQRNAITSPPVSLLIYQTNAIPGFYYYSGTAWTPIGANTTLSNLNPTTSINSGLLPSLNGTLNIGGPTLKWNNLYINSLQIGGGTQTMAFVPYISGAGINISGTSITNTSPDQVITLTGTGSTTISGIYPSFTISSTDNNATYTAGAGLSLTGTTFSNTAPDQIITLTGGGSTTITGTYPDFTITSSGGGSGWLLSGNAGTIDGVDFIGTTDWVPLSFRVGNENAGKIDLLWQNTFFGHHSGESNISGMNNNGIGYNALFTNSYGSFNVANGVEALYFNTVGFGNNAFGYYALHENTEGSYNTALGWNALGGNMTGNFNTAVGYNATVGYENLTNATAIGYNAIVTASNAMALGGIGADAVKVGIGVPNPQATLDIAGNIKIADGTQGEGKVLTSDENGLATWTNILIPPPVETAFWSLTGNSGLDDDLNFIGTLYSYKLNFRVNNQNAGRIDAQLYNTFLGAFAGNLNSAGNMNTAYGGYALSSNLYGSQNTAVGVNALVNCFDGNKNTAIGTHALNFNSVGEKNTATGVDALMNCVGNNNTASGTEAAFFNSNGSDNTAIGYSALRANTNGNYNTALGSWSYLNGDLYSNSTALGYNSEITAGNQIRIGNADITSIGGFTDWTNISDKRFKKDIQNKVPGLEFITRLNPVIYHLDMDAIANYLKTPDSLRLRENESIKGNILQTGFIAQEVEKAANEIGYEFSGVDKPKNENDYYGLRYAEFVVPLVKSVQELDSINKDQDDQIQNQQLEIDLLKQQIEILTSAINSTELIDGIIQLGTQNPAPMLGQNVPNPFDNSTLIPFRIPKECRDASLMISNLSEGKVITVIPISCNETHISFEAGQLPAGNYTYSLIVDGKIIDTKQMELVK